MTKEREVEVNAERSITIAPRPWRASALAATAAYFGFSVVWTAVIAILYRPPVPAHESIFSVVSGITFNGIGFALEGLFLLIGWIFWGAALFMTRSMIYVTRLLGWQSWFMACLLGAVCSLPIGLAFAGLLFGGQYERYREVLVAAPVNGILAGSIAYWTSGAKLRPSPGARPNLTAAG